MDSTTRALERWLEHALANKQREHQMGSSPYDCVPTAFREKAIKRRRKTPLKALRLPHVREEARVRQAASVPPEESHPGRVGGSAQGGRTHQQQQQQNGSGIFPTAEGGSSSATSESREKRLTGGADARLTAADLAAKKMLLPFINELSFIEIALAARGNPSGGDLASSNPVAEDAVALFQSSYLFMEGLYSLGKATGNLARQASLTNVPKKAGDAMSPAPGRGLGEKTNAPPRQGRPQSTGSSLGKRGRGSGGGDISEGDISEGDSEEGSLRGLEGEAQSQHRRIHRGTTNAAPGSKGHAKALPSSSSGANKQIAPPWSLPTTSPSGSNGRAVGERNSIQSLYQAKRSKSSMRNPDVAGVLRRYPQFCESMSLTSQAMRDTGLSPKYHPPTWSLSLCEEILDKCWEAEALTAPGGARALRNARRAAAGADARFSACTTEVDKWCLAQAKDLEVLEEGERSENREQRRKRRQRRRRHNLRQTAGGVGGGGGAGEVDEVSGKNGSEASSGIRLPVFVATFLSEKFGVKPVTLQAAVDLLFGLETLRSLFPELEHFSLLLRELHDVGAFALVLHAREVVSRLGGLRLRDVKRRLARPICRPPLRREVVVVPHPALPRTAAQAWLTRKGCLIVAFLLLGGGARGACRSKVEGIFKDARHLTSSARAAVGADSDSQQQDKHSPSSTPHDQAGSASAGEYVDGEEDEAPENTHGAMETRDEHVASPPRLYSQAGIDGPKKKCLVKKARDDDSDAKGIEGASLVPPRTIGIKGGRPNAPLKIGNDGRRCNADAAFVPLHGLLFLLCDLHMKTPEEIVEKDKSADKAGGLDALTTLARAVEQENRREELSSQLADETRTLDMLAAEVLRLEARTRALEEGAAASTSASVVRGLKGDAAGVDGLAQVRVALALKSASARRQHDVVRAIRSEVCLVDNRVAASWHDVMSPALPPAPGADTTTGVPLTGSTDRAGSTLRTTRASSGNITSSGIICSTSGGGFGEDAGAEAAAAAEAGEMMSFAIEAGDGLNEDDAAELNAILQQKSAIEMDHGRNQTTQGSNAECSTNGSAQIATHLDEVSTQSGGISQNSLVAAAGRGGSTGPSLRAQSLPSSSWSSRHVDEAAQATMVPGSMPLEVRPGVAARKVLRILRMHVAILRVTKDNEIKAETLDWKQKLGDHKLAAAIAIQRWARRIRKDTTMIFLAKQKAGILRYARDKAKRHALAEEERQVFAAREVLKRQQMRILQEQEAVETILKDAMIREADQRYWRARAKKKIPIIRAWRMQVRVEARFRSVQRRHQRLALVGWDVWMGLNRKEVAAAAKIKHAWLEHRGRSEARVARAALVARQDRVKAYVIQALGRSAGERFARWKCYTKLFKKVKLMGGVHTRQGIQQRLKRWKAFVGLARRDRHEAATRIQSSWRARQGRHRTDALRRERWARTMIGRQLTLQVAVVRFGKFKRRMARVTAEAKTFRQKRDMALSIRALRAWRVDAHKCGGVRKKIMAVTQRRRTKVLKSSTSAWRAVAAESARERREREQAKEGIVAKRRSAATGIQAAWRSRITREDFKGRLRDWRSAMCIQKHWKGYRVRSTVPKKAELQHGAVSLQRLYRGHRSRSRYSAFFLRETARAASTGRYERLFWLIDRWPALVQQDVFSAFHGEGAGEGVLHLACRAAAHRCVQLCLDREVDVRAVAPAGLTPLHALATYSNYWRSDGDGDGDGDGAGHDEEGYSTTAHAGGGATEGSGDEWTRRKSRQHSAVVAARQTAAAGTITSIPTTGAAGGETVVSLAAAPEAKALVDEPSRHDPKDLSSHTGAVATREQREQQYEHQLRQRKHSVDNSVRAIADLLLDAGGELDAVDGEGSTPLMIAAGTGGAALCELLLARGADSSARNFAGSSALFLAVMGSNPAQSCSCVGVLLNAGCNPDESRPDGTAALHVAAGEGHSEVLSDLLQHGAKVDALDALGMTPLMYAINKDHGDATGLLCDYGADLDLVDAYGRTALHVAAQDGQIKALSEILGRSVDTNAKDAKGGETALHYAASSGKVEAVQALLESGADPNVQNVMGDNAAHLAARAGYLEIVQALVAYDIHIGQRNWQEYTPFGEARMNNHLEVAEFLSASFIRLGETAPVTADRNIKEIDGELAGEDPAERADSQRQREVDKEEWDREMQEKAYGWDKQWDEEKQRFYYFNAGTWETSYLAPFKMTAERVEELREGAMVAYVRKVAAVKGESLMGLSDYREAVEDEKADLNNHMLRSQAATVVQSGWRARGARQQATQLRKELRSAKAMQRLARRFLGRRRRERWARLTSACLVVQRIFRGFSARRKHRANEAGVRWQQSIRRLNRLLTRVYRGHLYGRKPARKLRAQREAAVWGPSEWETAVYNAREPTRTFYGWEGHWEAYLLRDSVDVMFYRNIGTEGCTWDMPAEWQSQDAYDFYQREHARMYGFTAEEAQAATMLQNAWRGRRARDQFHLLLRAQRICKGAELAYLADPESLRCQINYILFTHIIEKDYNRARILYTTALAAMEERGPDMPLLLLAFAIFCLVTGDEDMISIMATVERAIAAEAAENQDGTINVPDSRWPPESYASRRNPKSFALAEAGFFRFAAYKINDAESWHNYAACRQLGYGDYNVASDYYLKAIERDPRDSHLQANYQTLMDTFPEDSQGSSAFESLSVIHRHQADSDQRRQDMASAKFLKRPEVKQAALKLERAYLRSRQRQVDKFGSYLGPTGMLLREVHEEARAMQREHTPSLGNNISRRDGHQARPDAALSLPLLEASRPASESSRSRILPTQGNRLKASTYCKMRSSSILPQSASATDGRQMEEYAGNLNQAVPPYYVGSTDDRANPDTVGPLPPGWEAVDSGTDGGVYYHEMASGLTQWEMPKQGTAGASTTVTFRASAESEWEEFHTAEAVPYWYNPATGESSWEAPAYRAER